MSDISSYINGNTANSGDSWNFLQQVLDQFKLTGADAQQIINDAYAQQWNSDRISQALRTTASWQQEYAPIVERQKLGLPPISETDVQNLRSQYSQIDQQMGAPEGFNGKQDYDQFIVNNMSAVEYKDRWVNGYQQAEYADPATKAALANYYGATDGHLASYFVDPAKSEQALLNNLAAAKIGGTASSTGYGAISRQQAESLQTLGIDQQAAQKGFSQLGAQHELFNSLPGQNEQTITQQQLDAAFNNNTTDQQLIEQRARQRVGAFQGGGGYTPQSAKGSPGGAGVAQ